MFVKCNSFRTRDLFLGRMEKGHGKIWCNFVVWFSVPSTVLVLFRLETVRGIQ